VLCSAHRSRTAHSCDNKARAALSVQATVCLKCKRTVVFQGGEKEMHTALLAHLSNPKHCRPKSKKKRCAHKGCRTKLLNYTAMRCDECGLEYCLAHRHPSDHVCTQASASCRREAGAMKGGRSPPVVAV
jgi:hypothetical protein